VCIIHIYAYVVQGMITLLDKHRLSHSTGTLRFKLPHLADSPLARWSSHWKLQIIFVRCGKNPVQIQNAQSLKHDM